MNWALLLMTSFILTTPYKSGSKDFPKISGQWRYLPWWYSVSDRKSTSRSLSSPRIPRCWRVWLVGLPVDWSKELVKERNRPYSEWVIRRPLIFNMKNANFYFNQSHVNKRWLATLIKPGLEDLAVSRTSIWLREFQCQTILNYGFTYGLMRYRTTQYSTRICGDGETLFNTLLATADVHFIGRNRSFPHDLLANHVNGIRFCTRKKIFARLVIDEEDGKMSQI